MNIFKHENFDNHEQITFFHDEDTGLKAIIAIHNTQLGPALGGCRFYPYSSEEEALTDVLKLSRGMTYKSSISGLNFGGGKAVIIGDPKKITSEALFRRYGMYVEGLGGRYITAEDVNTNTKFMEWVNKETDNVVGLPTYLGGLGNPALFTAHGVFCGIKASLKKVKGNDSLKGVKIAVQGVGSVGYNLCKELHEEEAIIYATDLNAASLERVHDEFEVNVVKPEEIFGLDVDVFSPCAMGGIINDETIPQLKCQIITGGANNQLKDEKKHAKELAKLGITYAPHFVVNAGGLIGVTAEYLNTGRAAAWANTEEIYSTLLTVFHVTKENNITTIEAANKMALDRIEKINKTHSIYV